MDQAIVLAIVYPVIVGIVSTTIGAIILWAIIRSATLSALRKHEQASASRYTS